MARCVRTHDVQYAHSWSLYMYSQGSCGSMIFMYSHETNMRQGKAMHPEQLVIFSEKAVCPGCYSNPRHYTCTCTCIVCVYSLSLADL